MGTYVPVSPAAGPLEHGYKGTSPRSGSSSPRPGLLASTLSPAWLPVAALCGALLTLAVISLGGKMTGPRWAEYGAVPAKLDTHQLSQRAERAGRKEAAAAATAAAQRPPLGCPACPQQREDAADCPPPVECPACTACPPCEAAAAGGGGGGAAQGLTEEWVERLRVPWGPLLTQQEALRGLSYYGSGARIQAVASKLLAGQPIKVFTLGASVTRGIGTTDRKYSYASRFFEFINAAFPHKDHVFVNRGIGGTSSSIYSVCAEHMVAEDADLVVLEFSANDKRDAAYTDPERRGYEQLVRKLLALPGRPALIQLHHYAWWHAVGDGEEQGGLFYYPAGEQQLGALAHYYDFPAVSVRAAMWHLMRARVPGFNPDRARLGATLSPTNVLIPGADLGTEKTYWYRDRTHPGDEGHGMLAELLAHVLACAVVETLAPRPVLHLPRRDADMSAARDGRGLPVPAIPGNAATPTTLCAIEEGFKDVVTAQEGFEYKAQRPEAKYRSEQKWGWVSDTPGSWVEMEFDSESGFQDLIGNGTDKEAQVSLSYLKSYQGMGTADLACVSGCECPPQRLDGTWAQEVSLQQVLQFYVTRHKACRLRVTVSDAPGQVAQDGHKVLLQGVMVSQFDVRLTIYDQQAKVLHEAIH